MLWHLIKYIVVWFFPVFFKRIRARNIHYLHTKSPAIIAMNHPNSFADPILLTWNSYPPVRPYYLARGDAFKPGLISFILQSIGIIPIFRLSDGGKEGLNKNNETYKAVNRLLAKGEKVIVFAEGLCVVERRLRPLKKGVARMVFGAMDEIKRDDLLVIPIGVNYDAPTTFRSQVFYNIGEPMRVKDFLIHETHPAKAQKAFLDELQVRMKGLITHIDNPKFDRLVERLEIILKSSIMAAKNQSENDLWFDFQTVNELTKRVNQADELLLEELNSLTTLYFDQLSANNVSDEALNPQKVAGWRGFLPLRVAGIILGLPFLIIGFTANFLVLWWVHRLASTLIKAKEFYTSLAIALGSFIFTAWYLLWFFVLKAITNNGFLAAGLCLLAAGSGIACLYLYPWLIKTKMLFKLRFNPALQSDLASKRLSIVEVFNKI